MCGKVTPVILHGVASPDAGSQPTSTHSSEFFIGNQLVGTHLITKMILMNRPCAMGVWMFCFRKPYIYRGYSRIRTRTAPRVVVCS